MVRLEGSGKEEVASELRDEEGEKRGVGRGRRWRSGKGGEAKDRGSSKSAWH